MTPDVTEILTRIKRHFRIKKDAQLAAFLDCPPNTLSTWKSRNAPNWELLFDKCEEMNFDYMIKGYVDNRILKGKGEGQEIADGVKNVKEVF